ncbi:MAG: hypothetical protein K0R59_241 [Sphingobacterium sp.]|jgi:hypothetical protein|nr:hypothetical protein [Sphingobacterium sp.]
MKTITLFSLTLIIIGQCGISIAQEAKDINKKLANPVASLISVPFQNNTDYGIGRYDGSRNILNMQPVIPMSFNKKYNLITRVIVPLISQYNITGENEHQTGLGDILASAFLSPKAGKITFGAGPAVLIPVATNAVFATKKLSIGPTAVALIQKGPWTFGALTNQIWSVAGSDSRRDVSQLYIQPFAAHNWSTGGGLSLTGELTQDWKSDHFSVVLIPTGTAVTRMGRQTLSFAIGPRIPIAAPDGHKSNFGFRAAVTLVYPK